ncbi:hypothetical protein AVEN_203882-1 [Araneus ventricosus]|uniref:Uncharacterized protein n=1 Tax=Araneus ventricosus TaxID=182803 RepID=A0A4Y2J3V1_ARAVE|nr:hypothetical protein AVEN_231463-1 [Araneus ventricosus]GBM84439.1 hypothetical protein AVEN_273309-1 [Araneus ventricosus]GBM84449.1 hypothetical protein AVEN_31756-1 [Araneus ventricosus]GBM84468.1 hypothetical protein AVEN_203882-1 [Araneus ventricosus]
MPICIPGTSNDSRCDNSSTEAGVLIVITGHDPNLHEGGTYYHRREATRTPSLLYQRGKRDPADLSGGFSSWNSRYPQWESDIR